jgi:putative acetyltransferase
VTSGWFLRPETRDDWSAIDAVHQQAFGQPGEAALVRALRSESSPYVALVAEQGGSPPALGLGPVAVAPGLQRGGIGSALVRAGLDRCAALARIVVVLGHAAWYPRFGFQPAFPRGLRYRSEQFDPSFFVLELAPGALAGGSGRVRYHAAFERL